VAVGVRLLVVLAALVAVAAHQTRRVLHQPSSAVALALEVKEMLAVPVFVRKVTRPVKVAAAAVRVVGVQQPHPLAGLVRAVPVFPTPYRLALHNPTLVAVVVDQ
jgi:hypothetical protein